MAPLPASKQRDDFYQILGCSRDASYEELKAAFHRKAGLLHPDKAGSPEPDGDDLLELADDAETFNNVRHAWSCLQNDSRRIIYDMTNFGSTALCPGATQDVVENKLTFQYKLQALTDIQNMQVELEKTLMKERAAGGVLVVSALYGHLRLKEELVHMGLSGERSIVEEDLVGPVIDVTLPLQCLVEKHKLQITGGPGSSKASLAGFYNPAPLNNQLEISLYVLYEFRGVLHEILIGDREKLDIPMRKHAVPAGGVPRGPFSGENTDALFRLARQPDSPPPVVQESPEMTQAPPLPTPLRRLRPAKALAVAIAEYRRQQILVDGRQVSQRDMVALLLGAGTAYILTMLLELRMPRILSG